MGECSMPTCAQSASSSSASSIARPVCTPWPISDLLAITVTLLSAPTLTQPFSAAWPGRTRIGAEGMSRWRGGSTDQPITNAPAAPALPSRKCRRLIEPDDRRARPPAEAKG